MRRTEGPGASQEAAAGGDPPSGLLARYETAGKFDLDALRCQVADWLDEHPDGIGAELAAGMAALHPGERERDIGAVARGMMYSEQERRGRLPEARP
jgi:hypothetical protein